MVSSKSGKSGTKVLLAEDEEHIAKLILFKLGKEGFAVTWASDGEKALELSLNQKWDVIVLDVMMPVQDGWQVLKEVRKLSKHVPILMLSAKGSEKDIARSEELGATRFIKKPFDPAHLVSVIHEMTGKKATSIILHASEELDEVREEFIESFEFRRKSLITALASFSSLDEKNEETLKHALAKISFEVKLIAHNIAGVAGSYGFPTLGSIAARIDDSLVSEVSLSKLITCGERLEQALEYCFRLKADCTEHGFTSSEESPAFEATP